MTRHTAWRNLIVVALFGGMKHCEAGGSSLPSEINILNHGDNDGSSQEALYTEALGEKMRLHCKSNTPDP